MEMALQRRTLVLAQLMVDVLQDLLERLLAVDLLLPRHLLALSG
jgi:hypothetical protein